MIVDISSTPFSRYGEFVSVGISSDEQGQFLVIRNVRAMKDAGRLLGVKFLKNSAPAPFTIRAEPHVINISSPEGTARLYIRSKDAVVIDSTGLDVELKMLQAGISFPEGDACFKFQVAGVHVAISTPAGTPVLRIDRIIHEDGVQRISHTSVTVGCVDGRALLHLELQLQERPLQAIDPDRDIADAGAQWLAFRAKMPPVPPDRVPIAELAWYTLWAAFVRPEGFIKYDACLMSKATMCALWSWDHCFNALAIAHADPVLGLRQFLLPFELQSDIGQLPDRWSSLVSTWTVNKPPIHGWCLSKLLKHFTAESGSPPLSQEMLRKLYTHLEKWTGFWFTWRDTDADGIPNYVWGLDSGWDNSTLFDPAFCPEAPDLTAFLILQMDALAELATLLDDSEAASAWNTRADSLLAKLYDHSWKGDRFVAPISITHAFDPAPTTLLALMPLALGKRLDPARCKSLIKYLGDDFLTDHGPATESPSSPLYLPDGYWRSPIWAPSTYLLVDGLARAGHGTLAKTIALRFCNMVREAGGHYENYDALTGRGLCDQGYTWTASVHLLLLNEYLQ